VRTLSVKVRPEAWAWLDAAARETNMVWNHVNELCAKAARPYYGAGRWLSGFDVARLLAGSSKELTYLPSHSITEIAVEHARRRQQFKRTRLRWRRSGGTNRSLGWVPFSRGQVKFKRGAIQFAGRRFRVFDSYGLADFDLRAGSFSQNALGEWFLNVFVMVERATGELPAKAVGIDLGLKDVATTSDSERLPAGRWFRDAEQKVSQAQRRGHKRQAKRLHKKAANRRKDALHKFSASLVERYGAIYVGDVSSTKLVKTRMAKSVLDSGWGMLRTMLQYKGHQAGRIVESVNEAFTTQACSCCGSLTGPRGRTGLVVRGWTCVACGTTHSRDVNAARNILAAGLGRPSAGTGVASRATSGAKE